MRNKCQRPVCTAASRERVISAAVVGKRPALFYYFVVGHPVKPRQMKAVFCFLFALLTARMSGAQSDSDSLEKVLETTPVNRISLQHYLSHLQAADPKETALARLMGEWVIKNSGADSLQEIQARANFLLGRIFTLTANYEEAGHYLTAAQIIAEKKNFYTVQAETLNALGSLYGSNEQHEKALELYKKSLAISKAQNFLPGTARALFNLGNAELNTGNRTPAAVRASMDLMRQGLRLMTQLKDTQSMITQSRGMSGAYTLLKNYDSALLMLGAAEGLLKASGKEFPFISHYNQTAKLYNNQKKYSEAIKYYETGLRLAKKYEVPRWMCMYYNGMAETYENTGDYKKANHYNQLNIQMHDALVSKENFAAAADIQNRYERAKKDNEILKLAAVNQQKSVLNNVLTAAAAVLAIIGFLGYLYFKNRSKIARQQEVIQQQKIIQLERDKQLVAVDAMLKGQEEERSRVAKDLHDGLGGLLSGTKLSFMNLKEALDLPSGAAVQFDRSLSMLDNTINDLRKVAQNLMPEALVKFGLHEAVRDFCDSIESSSGIKVLYRHYGTARKLPKTAAVFIYRIVQELVNNAVKHAGASQITVQLTTQENRTSLAVEDDGNGFDTALLRNAAGAGMANVNYRVRYFNGSTDVVSSPGNGTSVNIELNA